MTTTLGCQPERNISITADQNNNTSGQESESALPDPIKALTISQFARKHQDDLTLPGGFEMGIAATDADWDAGHEPHWVELTKEFPFQN